TGELRGAMAHPAVLNVDDLLAPIAEDQPSGRSLVYETEYGDLREARRSEDDTPQGDWAHEVKVAEWDAVIEIGTEALTRKTKDLQIAAWITEALGHLHGFPGL